MGVVPEGFETIYLYLRNLNYLWLSSVVCGSAVEAQSIAPLQVSIS